MAKPRVFLSSTFYDLKQVRADLKAFFNTIGYESIQNEEGNIPYGNQERLEEYCYKEIKSVDILISIIGGRFGSQGSDNQHSISQLELKTAQKEDKQVYIFIDKNVYSEYETFVLNKGNDKIKYRYVDDARVYEFIEEMKSLSVNNNIKAFETANDITSYLKEQLAGLFQKFLENQQRIKEGNLINNLEKTAQTLNKLVNFLSDQNKEQAEKINRILTIDHPLVEQVSNHLGIKFNFYIEGLNDLEALLIEYGYIHDTEHIKDGNDPIIHWIKRSNRKEHLIKIPRKLFDEEGKLKFVRKTDWNKNNFITSEIDTTPPPYDDDLPF